MAHAVLLLRLVLLSLLLLPLQVNRAFLEKCQYLEAVLDQVHQSQTMQHSTPAREIVT